MKKILYLIFLITGLLLAVTSCQIDNFPEPDAQVYGAIRDSVGGGLIETEMVNGSQIGTYELGEYSFNPELRNWAVKENGEYRNNLVYSNTYKIDFINCNFFPYTIPEIQIKPGSNAIDFLVMPYIRIKNLTITYDAVAKKVNASFNLEPGKSTVKVGSITLYVFTDMHVGENIKKTIATGTGTPTRSYGTSGAVINTSTPYTLSIDVGANATTVFSVHRNYYFRVGAKGVQSGVGTVRSNFAPYVVIEI
jgi:hypothetical protein